MPTKCPACDARGIPLYQRVGWHRAHPMTCRACGGRFEVPMWARLAALALMLLSIPLALVLMSALREPVGSGLGAVVLGFTAAAVVLFVAVTVLFAVTPIRPHHG